MARLLQRYYIACPPGEGALLLNEAVDAIKEPDGSIDLCATFQFGGRNRTVRTKALLGAAVDGTGWRVVWPEGPRPPAFDGVLSMRDEEDFLGCVLQVEGDWVPRETPEAAPDRSREAAATARELLRRLSAGICDAYARRRAERSGA